MHATLYVVCMHKQFLLGMYYLYCITNSKIFSFTFNVTTVVSESWSERERELGLFGRIQNTKFKNACIQTYENENAF